MKLFLLSLAAIAALASPALADATTCTAQAAEKKLAGAAQTSFMKKCEADGKTACEKAAADKKLAGAAKTSFETKCLADAVGKT